MNVLPYAILHDGVTHEIDEIRLVTLENDKKRFVTIGVTHKKNQPVLLLQIGVTHKKTNLF